MSEPLIEPLIDNLIKVIDNKYALVVVTAKKARSITEENLVNEVGDEDELIKPVTKAMIEIANNKVDFELPNLKMSSK